MKTNWILEFQILVIAGLLCAPGVHADWSFVMLGDTRGIKDTTSTGVSLELPSIAQKIASLNPSLVMVAGDLINGNDLPADSSLYNYPIQFSNWKAAMQPVYNYSTNTGIPIYTVRGNHENMCSEGAPIPELKQAYYDAFHTYLPTNGPFNSTTDNQVGFSYSLIKNNVTFVAADQYFYYDEAAADPYHALDQKYVSDQLTSSNTTFKILMAHVPVFQTEGGGESEHFFGDNTSGNQTRSDFWNMMSEDGVQLYLCGHIHNESVATTPVTDGGTILQLMAGNGGAPPDVVENLPEPGVDVLHTSGQFGFSLATVGTDSMTIQYYSLDTADNSWSIADYATVIVPEPSSACLLALGMMVLVFLCLRHHDPANRRRRYSITFMALSPLAGRLSGCPPARIRHFATKPAWKLCLQLELTGNRPRHPKSDFYQQIFDFLCTGCAASLGQREVTAGDRPAAMRTRRGAERRLR